MPPDVWTSYAGPLRDSVGRIHWAGTETGGEGYGAMQSAIGAANRVVQEITGRARQRKANEKRPSLALLRG
jgi:monoamine oxidase